MVNLFQQQFLMKETASVTNNVKETEEDETTLNNSEVPESEGRTQDNDETTVSTASKECDDQPQNASHVSITNISNISCILASNNIYLDTNLETNLELNHHFLPNISSLSEPVPEANSTLSREVQSPPPTSPPACPPSSPPAQSPGPSSRPNIVASACFQAESNDNETQRFQPRRKRPSDLNELTTKQKRRRTPPPPIHSMLRRSSRSGSSAVNIQKTLDVNVGHPRNVETMMFIPRNLGDCFHSACSKQTQEGLEMGGILAGKFDELEQSYQVTSCNSSSKGKSCLLDSLGFATI